MYENMTYANILSSLLSYIPEGISKIEGSLVYNALSPAAFELEKAYIQLDYILAQSFMDTVTEYSYAEMRAAERGIVPTEATHAVVKAVFNVEVPIGTRFSKGAYNYVVTEKISDKTYKLSCEETGSAPNGNMGALTAITYVEGLKEANITELLVPGEDKESLESLKKRYFASFHSQSFGGNKAYYKEYVNAINGVGGTKVYPVWNGGGTVKLSIISSEFTVPSAELIAEVQKAVCPEPYMGDGIAPIGHDVTVIGVEAVTLNISSSYSFESGYDFNKCKAQITQAAEKYLNALSESWAEQDALKVYISRLEAEILTVQGIVDITGTTLNGKTDNFTLTSDQIPVLGEVTAK